LSLQNADLLPGESRPSRHLSSILILVVEVPVLHEVGILRVAVCHVEVVELLRRML
jgi:hypothetical protein